MKLLVVCVFSATMVCAMEPDRLEIELDVRSKMVTRASHTVRIGYSDVCYVCTDRLLNTMDQATDDALDQLPPKLLSNVVADIVPRAVHVVRDYTHLELWLVYGKEKNEKINTCYQIFSYDYAEGKLRPRHYALFKNNRNGIDKD